MPLQPDFYEDFVQVKTVNVDTKDAYVISSDGFSNDVRVMLTESFSNVIGIEVENYSVPLQSLSQFTGKNKIDFRLRNPAIFGGQWKNFTAVIPVKPVLYNSPEAPSADLLTSLYEAFASVIGTDPDFGGKVDIVAVPDAGTTTRLICRTLAYPPLATWPGYGSTECEFLFDSGPNREESAAQILGFDNQDYTFFPITLNGTPFRVVVSPRNAQINRFRYLDILLDEVPEFKPFHRIFIPTIRTQTTSLPENASRMRLLSQPIRTLDRLTIRLRLAGGRKPFSIFPFYFSFRIFELKSSFALPEKEQERIKLV